MWAIHDYTAPLIQRDLAELRFSSYSPQCPPTAAVIHLPALRYNMSAILVHMPTYTSNNTSHSWLRAHASILVYLWLAMRLTYDYRWWTLQSVAFSTVSHFNSLNLKPPLMFQVISFDVILGASGTEWPTNKLTNVSILLLHILRNTQQWRFPNKNLFCWKWIFQQNSMPVYSEVQSIVFNWTYSQGSIEMPPKRPWAIGCGALKGNLYFRVGKRRNRIKRIQITMHPIIKNCFTIIGVEI